MADFRLSDLNAGLDSENVPPTQPQQPLQGLPATEDLAPSGNNGNFRLSDFNNAPPSTLEVLGATARSIGPGWQAVGGGLARAAGEMIPEGMSSFEVGMMNPIFGGIIAPLAEVVRSEDFQKRATEIQRSGAKRVQELRPEDMTFMQEAIYTTGMSFGVTIPATVAVAAVTRNPTLVLATLGTTSGLNTLGETYGALRDNGYTPEKAFAIGATMGAMEGVLGTWGAQYLFGLQKNFTRRFLKALTAEMGAEQANLLGQSLVAKLTFNPELGMGQVIEDAKLVAASVVLGSSAISVVGQGVQKGQELYQSRRPGEVPAYLTQDEGIIAPLNPVWQVSYNTPEFQRRFGNSQAVDENGQPQVVYHGSLDKFATFDPAQLGSATGASSAYEGFFFASNPAVAEGYGSASARTLREIPEQLDAVEQEILRLTESDSITKAQFAWGRGQYDENPRIALIDAAFNKRQELEDAMQSAEDPYSANHQLDDNGMLYKAYLSMQNPLILDDADGSVGSYTVAIQQAKLAGHDGVIIRNTVDSALEGGEHDPLTDLFIVFDPTQIINAETKFRDDGLGKIEKTVDPTTGEVRFVPTVTLGKGFLKKEVALESRSTEFEASRVVDYVLNKKNLEGDYVRIMTTALDGLEEADKLKRELELATGKEISNLLETPETPDGLIAGPFQRIERHTAEIFELSSFLTDLMSGLEKVLGPQITASDVLDQAGVRSRYGMSKDPIPARFDVAVTGDFDSAFTYEFNAFNQAVYILKSELNTLQATIRIEEDATSGEIYIVVNYKNAEGDQTVYAPDIMSAKAFLVEGPYADLAPILEDKWLEADADTAPGSRILSNFLINALQQREQDGGSIGELHDWAAGPPYSGEALHVPPGTVKLGASLEETDWLNHPFLPRMVKQLEWLLQRYAPNRGVLLVKERGRSVAARYHLDSSTIKIALGRPSWRDASGWLRVMTHEFWHGYITNNFRDLPLQYRRAIVRHYRQWIVRSLKGKVKKLLGELTTKPVEWDATGWHLLDMKVEDLIRQGGFENAAYIMNFQEFVVRHIERLALKDPRANKALGKIWGDNIVAELKDFIKTTVGKARPQDKILQAWFSERQANQDLAVLMENWKIQAKQKRATQEVTDISFENVPKNYEDILAIDRMSRDLGLPPEVVEVMRRSAGDEGIDKYNNFIRWGATLFQLANENLHIKPLQDYAQVSRDFNTSSQHWFRLFNEVIAKWQGLGKSESNNLGKFLQEWTLLKKRPNEGELATLAQKYRLSDNALAVFQEVDELLQSMLDRMQIAVEQEAEQRYRNQPDALAVEKINILSEFQNLRNRPYFPLMRFGKYTVMLRAKQKVEYGGQKFVKGQVVAFETFESEKEQQARLKELRKKYSVGHETLELSASVIMEEFQQFVGLPPSLVDALARKVGLDETQQLKLSTLVKEMAPAHKFIHHLSARKEVSGFSTDALRGLALYGWQGARHMARILHFEDFQRALKHMKHYAIEASKREGGGVKAAKIYEHLARHNDYVMNPPSEWAALRSLGFTWFLGFNVKSALVNMTQLPLVVYPYLAQRYGDAAALDELRRGVTDTFAYYRKAGKIAEKLRNKPQATLTSQEREMLELANMIEEFTDSGLLSQSFATELAATKEGGALHVATITKKSGRFLKLLGHYGAWMFQHAEGVTRHAAAIAAYRLARQKGYSVEAARLSARQTVESTIYEYSNFNRPEFMRGRKSVFFLFWQFLQNTAYIAGGRQGAGTALRLWLMLFYFAGLQGLPGADDLMEFSSWAWTKLSGEHKDVKHEIRGLLTELVDNPDYLMHGTSRATFGLPWLGEAMGIYGIPEVDFSGSMSMGKLLPGVEAIFARSGDWKARMARAQEDAIGAFGAIPFGILRTAFEKDPDTWKRLEHAMPAAARGVSRAVRRGVRGEETNRQGAVVAEFDPWEPRQAAELVAQALGGPTTRVQQEGERAWALRQVSDYWTARRTALMSALDWAWRNGDREAMAETLRSMKEFNNEVPFPSLGIRGNDLRQSLSQRALARWKRERGLPGNTRDLPLTPGIQERFPVSSEEEEAGGR